MFAGDLAGTKSLLDALSRQRDVSHPEDRGYIVIGYGRLALYEGRVATAVRHLREGISALDETNRQGRQGWGLGLLAEALAVAGDVDGAIRRRGRGRTGDPPHEPHLPGRHRTRPGMGPGRRGADQRRGRRAARGRRPES